MTGNLGEQVADDSAVGAGHLVPATDECDQVFAALIEASRREIMLKFAQRITDAYGFTPEDRGFFDHAMGTAADVISDVVRSVRAGEVVVGCGHVADAQFVTQASWDENLTPADNMAVVAVLLNVVLAALTACVGTDAELMPHFTLATTALNESVIGRMRGAAGACAATMLERVHLARAEERRRIARDLHDRVGEVLSVGLRRLDLLEITGPVQPPPAEVSVAREAVVEAMRRLRVVTSDLREPPVSSLEKALLEHLDSVCGDTEVRLYIGGDETQAPPMVIDEVFLIVHEALRNALDHGAPRLVLVGVEVGTRELSAWVIDDGCGFSPVRVAGPDAVGTGLACMRERAAVIGGRMTVSSLPGHGTRVELHVPLAESQPGRDGTGHDGAGCRLAAVPWTDGPLSGIVVSNVWRPSAAAAGDQRSARCLSGEPAPARAAPPAVRG